ncbi:hypothetical protein pipiens_012209 [Culex pipiens pipiens]|uniref:MEIOB-like N-terminal domain-containing protein n=1 Tax=Culex pipiens pipiens TaxID=38569 RepID=A0ABD1D3A9_CULPP
MSTDIVVTKRIHQLCQDSQNFILIGVVIAKSDPKYMESTTMTTYGGRDDGTRGVITLTLRDSERDTINCTVWASQVAIDSFDSLFHIGDVVNVSKAKVLSSSSDRSEQFAPRSTSPYSLKLNALQDGANIKLHEGSGLEQMRRLVTVAPVDATTTYQLADIAAGGHSHNGQSVNILAVVRCVRPKKQIVVAKTGKIKNLREVIVMDATHSGMSMKFWSNEYVERIDKWTPLTTVLLMMDVRIEYNEYFKSICLGMSSKTIITEDPACEQADRLLVSVMRVPLQDSDVAFSATTSAINTSVITTVMSVQQIWDRAEGDLKSDEDQFTALCYAVVTKFDLDGCSRLIGRTCQTCKSFVRVSDDRCSRPECAYNPANIVSYFDIRIDLTDHTGTLANCRLMNQVAEQTLACKVDKFLNMSDEEKGKLKWRILLERCAVKLVVKRKSPVRFQTVYSVAECVVAGAKEVEGKIKVY